jgi:hypothetical protein
MADHGLDRRNYLNREGELTASSFMSGLSRAGGAAWKKEALVADALICTAAHGLLKGTNFLAGGAIERSPGLRTLVVSGSFGMSSGAYGEIMRQEVAGERLDPAKIALRALIQGAVDTAVAGPGGASIHAEYRTAQRVAAPGSLTSLGSRLSSFSDVTRVLHWREGEQTIQQEVPVVRFDLGKTSIFMPRDHYEGLKEVRELRKTANGEVSGGLFGWKSYMAGRRLDSHPLGKAVLPEDALHMLDQLPVPDGEFGLVLHKGSTPWDSVSASREHLRKHGDPLAGLDIFVYFLSPEEVAGKQATKPEIHLYTPFRHELLPEIVRHEWSHFIDHVDAHEMQDLFVGAALLEKNTSARRAYYAKSCLKENWAVHVGEEFLSPDESRFARFVKDCPMKAVAAASILQKHLEHVPPEQQSEAHRLAKARCEIALEEALPVVSDRARKMLAEVTAAGKNPERFLDYFLDRFSELNENTTVDYKMKLIDSVCKYLQYVDALACERAVHTRR